MEKYVFEIRKNEGRSARREVPEYLVDRPFSRVWERGSGGVNELGEGAFEARADFRECAELDAVNAFVLVEFLDGVAIDAGTTNDFGKGTDFSVVHDLTEVAADCSCLHRLASLVTDRRVHGAVRPRFAWDGVLDEHGA